MAATGFSEILKPNRFDVDPNAPGATKLFKHWLKTLENFLESAATYARAQEIEEPNRFKALCAYVGASVYELIEDCTNYDAAMLKLQRHYVKQPNVVFSRHLLATRKQKPGESLQEFLQALQILSKNCQFRDVSAEECRQELVRDAFVNGLASHHIRQRLLKNTELTVDRAYTTAMSLHMAQEHSAVYYSKTRVTATVSPKDEPTATKQALMTTTRRQCFFCGRAYHERKYCPAINSTCFSCGKIGHFSRVCRSNNGSGKRLKSPNQSAALSLASLTSMACPGNLLRSAILVNLNGKNLTALIDSGSSESYINSKVSKDLKLKVYPSRREIQMASSAMKMKSNGFCLVDLELKGNKYESTRLNVFENLCSDVILGLDFQGRHQRVIFEFNGESNDLVISGKSTCAVTAASTDAVSLFSNSAPEAKPIVTKSRRFNQEDREFIQRTIDKWLEAGIIQSSSSPWRAQVVVVKDSFNRQRKRLCIYYSQTINIYTQLDAYPLPRIDDMINKYSVFSTFDLRSA